MKDYYKILGVNKTATGEDIKRAYRRLAHQHHPDKKDGNADRFKEVNEAYQVLSNKEKKAQYDRFGTTEPFSAGGFPGGGFGFNGVEFDMGAMPDMEDIFEMFFGGGYQRRKAYERGADLKYGVTITLEEAHQGTRKEISFPNLVKCEKCEGKGYDHDKGVEQCKTCAGRGEIKEMKKTFFGSFAKVKNCPDCRGTGEILKDPCQDCKGMGRVKKEKRVEVDIVPGIASGQIIKVAGAGEQGERGMAAGDLYVVVEVKPHSVFQRKGDDLLTRVKLSVVDLLLGKKIEIKSLLDKWVKVEIPAGFNLRDVVKVPGQGMPHFGASRAGDLIVSFEVETPNKLSKKAKELLEKLKEELE